MRIVIWVGLVLAAVGTIGTLHYFPKPRGWDAEARELAGVLRLCYALGVGALVWYVNHAGLKKLRGRTQSLDKRSAEWMSTLRAVGLRRPDLGAKCWGVGLLVGAITLTIFVVAIDCSNVAMGMCFISPLPAVLVLGGFWLLVIAGSTGAMLCARRAMLGLLISREIRRHERLSACIWCGYSLAGLSVGDDSRAICPECGRTSRVAQTESARASSDTAPNCCHS